MNLTASVVIASRDRGEMLARTLKSLEFQALPPDEVIVVGDAAAMSVAARYAGRVAAIPYDRANISVARNLGWQAAGGDVVAFIDDDAVAEPNWMAGLLAGMAQPGVQAAGGFVRGPNGISFQWRGERVDAALGVTPLELPDDRISVLDTRPGDAVGLMGTNFAVHRDVLADLGGFDPVIRYYLDETDFCLRLADRHARVAVVPMAQVHHGLAGNAWRRGDRVPRTLAPLGRSIGYVLARQGDATRHKVGAAQAVAAWRARALGLMQVGRIEPRDVGRLLRGLTAGIAAGAVLTGPDPDDMVPVRPGKPGNVPGFGGVPATRSVCLTATPWTARRKLAEARQIAATGAVVTLFDLSRTSLYHHVRFDGDGVWHHRGGLWGKSDRNDPLFRPWRCAARVTRERALREMTRDPEKAIQILSGRG